MSQHDFLHEQQSVDTSQPSYCLLQPVPPPSLTEQNKFFIASVVYVRIYEKDLAELSRTDFWNWMQYMRYAGSEHIYLYDCYHEPAEQLLTLVQPLIDSGFLTYIDWSKPEVGCGAGDRCFVSIIFFFFL